MALLETKSLRKTYEPDTVAVDNVSLAIDQGEIICLLGPSGCGKTTLLRMIAGLETPDSGEVWFDAQDMAPVPPHERDFGMMFQDFALFPHKNVAENIAFGLKMHGLPQEAIDLRVQAMLELVDLSGYGERDVAQLSGGEQQRVALARSLAPEPRLLLLDEPLGALDRALRERLMIELRQILKEVGVTAVYVTHDQTEAFAIGDRIALMNEGCIEQLDTPQNVFHHPATEFAARFLGFQNLLPAVVTGPHSVDTAIGELRVSDTNRPAGSKVTLLIRSDAAQLTASDAPIKGTTALVTGSSFRGKYTQIWLDIDGERLMFEVVDDVPLTGSQINLAFDPQSMTILPA